MLWLCRPDSETTWEPATALSPSLVANYEAGIVTQSFYESQVSYGHSSTTVLVKESSAEPTAKKPRREQLFLDKEVG